MDYQKKYLKYKKKYSNLVNEYKQQGSIDQIKKRIGQLQGRSLEERQFALNILQREVDYTYKSLEEAVANHDKAKAKINQEILVQELEDTLKKESSNNPETKKELEQLYKKLEDLQ